MRSSENPDLVPLDNEIERTIKNLRKVKRNLAKEMEQINIQNPLFEQIGEAQPQQPPPQPQPRVLRDYFKPVVNENYSGIRRQPVAANNFELKPALINMVQQNQYGGLNHEDPNIHLATFLEICDTIKMNGVSDDIVRMRLFPFSLRDKARGWLQSLQAGSINSWDELAQKFLTKFFPPSKTSQLRGEIAQFCQRDFEPLFEAWERFKDLLRRCPQHGYQEWFQIQLFYNGLNGQTRTIIDAAAGGSLLSKTMEEAYVILEEMAANSYQWPNERNMGRRVASIAEQESISTLSAQVSALTEQLANLKGRPPSPRRVEDKVANMASMGSESGYEDCHFINNRAYTFKPATNIPTHYHPGLRNHENFSYANDRNVLQGPPSFNSQPPTYLNRQQGYTQPQVQEERKKPALEDILATFMMETRERFKKNEARLDNIETHCGNLSASMKNIETQVGQLATSIRQQMTEKFPSDTETNPRDCKAVSLRNGKQIEDPKKIERKEDKKEEEGTTKEQSEVQPGRIQFTDNPPLMTPPLPYPQRFQKKKKDEQFSKFVEMFKKIHINIPFAEALERMPNYAKFLKEIMSRKRKFEDFETVKLTEESCAVLKSKMPRKEQDPGSFTIPCSIGAAHFDKVLCDLGASINLMPMSIFKRLGLGAIKPTTISLQMADRSITYPWGIVEDVLVKVDKFIFPVDFVVLDMEEDSKIPIIFGRPFLATARANIDVHGGKLTLRVDEEIISFNIGRDTKEKQQDHSCKSVNSHDLGFMQDDRKVCSYEVLNQKKETATTLLGGCKSIGEIIKLMDFGRKRKKKRDATSTNAYIFEVKMKKILHANHVENAKRSNEKLDMPFDNP